MDRDVQNGESRANQLAGYFVIAGFAVPLLVAAAAVWWFFG